MNKLSKVILTALASIILFNSYQFSKWCIEYFVCFFVNNIIKYLLSKIPWTEEADGLQSMGLQLKSDDLVTKQQLLLLINHFTFLL